MPWSPNAVMSATARSGPAPKPPFPPTEKTLIPMPRFAPEIAFTSFAASGWKIALPTPESRIAAKIAQ